MKPWRRHQLSHEAVVLIVPTEMSSEALLCRGRWRYAYRPQVLWLQGQQQLSVLLGKPLWSHLEIVMEKQFGQMSKSKQGVFVWHAEMKNQHEVMVRMLALCIFWHLISSLRWWIFLPFHFFFYIQFSISFFDPSHLFSKKECFNYELACFPK